MVSGFTKVCFDSDTYVYRILVVRPFIITGSYVRKLFNGKEGAIFGYRLCE
jgi:hypothetical protein